ncbi:MAG: glycoside hydrolase family 3 C-terminal domain-containing protein, partial [Lachnospiraceae bacterium]|nr:glycoside hydrolase family 3 C-terminal domain-containing protein [Lachnospiraceae bacterium]
KYYGSTTPEVSERERKAKERVLAVAGECAVVFENDGVLPLKEKGNIALFGRGARLTIKGGTGSGDVNSRDYTTIEQGFEQAGFKVTSKKWLDDYDKAVADSKVEYQKEVKRIAKEKNVPEFAVVFGLLQYQEPDARTVTEDDFKASDCDTAIYVIARNSGEGCDRHAVRGDYYLAEGELEGIKAMAKLYKNSIVLLNIGGVMDIEELKKVEGLDAIVLVGQLGNITGNAVAKVVTGETVPSGKLTDTWAKTYNDYPCSDTFSHNNGNLDDEYHKEGIYVGYRYFDKFGIEPTYEFGFGKGYTTFEISDEDVTVSGTKVSVSAKVTNTGNFDGREVVQVYVSAPAGNIDKPHQELKAFVKTGLLKAGQSETVKAEFDFTSAASYSEADAAWELEKGTYFVRVGNSSRNTKVVAGIELAETKKTEVNKNLFKDPAGRVEEIKTDSAKSYTYASEEAEKSAAKKLTVDAATITTRVVEYQGERPVLKTDKTEKVTMDDILAGKATVEDMVAQLSVEELATVCVGHFAKDDTSIIGNAGISVPGAAGQTTNILEEDRHVKPLILPDGPAGLRLTPHFKVTDGKKIPGGDLLGPEITPFDESQINENTVDYYQYCTAIPIGMALATSWDMPMIEEMGRIVGIEMLEFNCDLWLAPAMNIHRNPLCGRNFEYYSEDPVIAGKCAAAMTKGVQQEKTVGTCIKHFAANSQEDNRYFVNSHISERAMREIYLKNFEIAVKESQPKSIMTSYNLINGVHAANCYDMLQNACRDEWGYEGLIMTDWTTTMDVPMLTGVYPHIYPIASSVGCIKAGNDLQEPGCQKNIDDIVEALNENKEIDGYKITLGDLQYCAANIIRIAAKCTR